MQTIVQEDAPVLRGIATPVPEHLFGSEALASILHDMAEALDREPDGVALAAPQIAVPYRIFIVRVDRTLPTLPHDENDSNTPRKLAPQVDVYINPEIVKTSRRRAEMEEGCLSVRGVYGTTRRHERVTVRAQRPDGTHFERGGGGLLAQIFEHETDHLNGILFIDHADYLIETSSNHEATV